MASTNYFKFHKYPDLTRTVASRHTILCLLALDAQWKGIKADGVDPIAVYDKSLMARLGEKVSPIVKSKLSDAAVFSHLLFLSEFRVNDTDVLVRHHPSCEFPGSPNFQLGKAGEELCDNLRVWDLVTHIEADAQHWQAVLLWGRLVNAGHCGPEKWTPEMVKSLTSLNLGQINRAVRMLKDGFSAKATSGVSRVWAADSIQVVGAGNPVFSVPSLQKVRCQTPIHIEDDAAVEEVASVVDLFDEPVDITFDHDPPKDHASEPVVTRCSLVGHRGESEPLTVELTLALTQMEYESLNRASQEQGVELFQFVSGVIKKAFADVKADSLSRLDAEMAATKAEYEEMMALVTAKSNKLHQMELRRQEALSLFEVTAKKI